MSWPSGKQRSASRRERLLALFQDDITAYFQSKGLTPEGPMYDNMVDVLMKSVEKEFPGFFDHDSTPFPIEFGGNMPMEDEEDDMELDELRLFAHNSVRDTGIPLPLRENPYIKIELKNGKTISLPSSADFPLYEARGNLPLILDGKEVCSGRPMFCFSTVDVVIDTIQMFQDDKKKAAQILVSAYNCLCSTDFDVACKDPKLWQDVIDDVLLCLCARKVLFGVPIRVLSRLPRDRFDAIPVLYI
ncbi:hypothetical protein RCL1_008865 [Eukaryota sp. TZLM3-RCL]